ncbi:hypothetical protein BDW22DRAFT_1174526 [Trametopsis cervina]|nr:hypothetical protein BDW22DRAFT_1174526 [Trametopsis cervina]
MLCAITTMWSAVATHLNDACCLWRLLDGALTMAFPLRHSHSHSTRSLGIDARGVSLAICSSRDAALRPHSPPFEVIQAFFTRR